MGTLEVRLFGTFQLQRDGQPVLRSTNRRVRDLLCYLLLKRDAPQSREHLAGVFWGEMDDSRARHCLNTALWRLQSALADPETGANRYLGVDAQSLRVNDDSDIWIDVVEFQARCTWATQIKSSDPDRCAALYLQAVDLYRGDLLVDSYDDWCIVEREYLQLLYVQSLNWLLTYYRERADLSQAIDVGRRILAIDPLREEVQRELIRLYLETGQRSAALRQYRACEAALSRELGVNPMPETRALLSEIMTSNDLPRDAPDPWLPGFAVVSSRTVAYGHSHSPNHNLALALQHLREASASFDRARQQLAGAVTLVEETLRSLDGGDSLIHDVSFNGDEFSPRPGLDRATAALATVVEELTAACGSSRHGSSSTAIGD